jgi:hypothetical protein
MARGKKPSVRCWDSRGAYCCWIAGEQHTLAKGPDDASTGPTYLVPGRRRQLYSASCRVPLFRHPDPTTDATARADQPKASTKPQTSLRPSA